MGTSDWEETDDSAISDLCVLPFVTAEHINMVYVDQITVL
jgi:hypothetical protein